MMLNGDSRGDREYIPPTAPVEVGVVSLVVRQPMRGRTGGGDGASGEGEGGDREGSKSGMKNFKKFRKVGTCCITYSANNVYMCYAVYHNCLYGVLSTILTIMYKAHLPSPFAKFYAELYSPYCSYMYIALHLDRVWY